MSSENALARLADDIATVIPTVDRDTEGQYGAGIGSEDEPRQVELLVEELQRHSSTYRETQLEVPYPDGSESCDLVLPDGTPVECKLLRYWRANGDPEDSMPKRVFSPFHEHTLLSDAQKLSESEFDRDGGLLGLFYERSDDDPETVDCLPGQYTAERLADKTARDIEYWFDIDVDVCGVAEFDGLQHPVQAQGAAITWKIQSGR
ncbi:hypothetical protein CK500_10130 [Halorubrum salipaludis]|uniref:Uncharacterized protein n=1 Tax=Halorubrum salipaludis TaxID=2032630 RepID=A0A2A2FER2_9EURY|nr:hypothetical protein [Halorubrum salipaludis]PAU83157.1 hypothetical protein CK500_10130 [Halorubrum salipaludis]